jgi:hypothetical protein
VLEQQPGRRDDALHVYEIDTDFPLSALQAAMLRWQLPSPPTNAAQPQQASISGDLRLAQDRLKRLRPSIEGEGPAKKVWGFKVDGFLLPFPRHEDHRCLFGLALAATQHQLKQESEAQASQANSKEDCRNSEVEARLLICDRLERAARSGNPRAHPTQRWLECQQGSSPA